MHDFCTKSKVTVSSRTKREKMAHNEVPRGSDYLREEFEKNFDWYMFGSHKLPLKREPGICSEIYESSHKSLI